MDAIPEKVDWEMRAPEAGVVFAEKAEGLRSDAEEKRWARPESAGRRSVA